MNATRLKQAIDDRGVKLKFISEKLGISRYGLYKKMNGESEFTASELKTIQEILQLPNEEHYEIFFK